MGIHKTEGDALSPLGRHIESVVPVRVLEADDVVLADIEELDKILDEDVLKDRAFTYLPLFVAQEMVFLRKI